MKRQAKKRLAKAKEYTSYKEFFNKVYPSLAKTPKAQKADDGFEYGVEMAKESIVKLKGLQLEK